MKLGFKISCVVLLLLAVCWPTFGQDDSVAAGYVPTWRVGDRWTLEATYRDLRQPGEVWLPPVQWIFKVRSMKVIDGQECYAVHVFPKQQDLKAQAVLYLAVKDLRPVKVIDVFQVGSKPRSQERELDVAEVGPLSSEGSLIPYDLPVFPLMRHSVQRADSYGAYEGPKAKLFSKIRKLGGLKFRRQASQKTQRPERQHADTLGAYRSAGEAFQVELGENRSNRNITQLWQEGSPWAISMESRDCKVRLVPPSLPTPLPEAGQGGDEQ